MVSFVLLFWYLIGETEETHEKAKAPGCDVKIWDRNPVYPHLMEHVEYFFYMKRTNMFVIEFFLCNVEIQLKAQFVEKLLAEEDVGAQKWLNIVLTWLMWPVGRDTLHWTTNF